ncbi:hypothetical protein [Xanthomonas euroxanthea]|uniref:hypothetical protein n=1 Tax=Xanthomonas euroxanthea TaxID=2259622 RepID=UPI00160C81A1|nr:hypothetical protein [Xanthomonas euroxanthea]MBB5767349.1 hypothetical protein [Xanthomonas euroxanthea]
MPLKVPHRHARKHHRLLSVAEGRALLGRVGVARIVFLAATAKIKRRGGLNDMKRQLRRHDDFLKAVFADQR